MTVPDEIDCLRYHAASHATWALGAGLQFRTIATDDRTCQDMLIEDDSADPTNIVKWHLAGALGERKRCGEPDSGVSRDDRRRARQLVLDAGYEQQQIAQYENYVSEFLKRDVVWSIVIAIVMHLGRYELTYETAQGIWRSNGSPTVP